MGASLHCVVLKCLKILTSAGGIYKIVDVTVNLLMCCQVVYMLSGGFLEAMGGDLGRGYSCL